ncbi:hypothetical protein ABTX15_17965 [Micromonospora sp. NPDC094482]|uniref:hypothetical protein n=1 Tax=unclassified Micromonospora TaxID=2617518 RepID=UPI00331D11A4
MDKWLTMAFSTISLIVSLFGLVYSIRSSRAAEKSAEAADKSASMAEKTVEVSARAAAVAEAGLKISFSVEIARHKDGAVWFHIGPIGANVYVHSVEVDMTIVVADGRYEFPPPFSLALAREEMGKFPLYIHDNDARAFTWQNPTLRLEDKGMFGFAQISYSLSRDSEIRSISKTCESEQGLSGVVRSDLLLQQRESRE